MAYLPDGRQPLKTGGPKAISVSISVSALATRNTASATDPVAPSTGVSENNGGNFNAGGGHASSERHGHAETDRSDVLKLHLAVSELFNAVGNVLLDEFELAEKCIHRARAVLQSGLGLADLTTSRLFLPPNETESKRVQGGLAP
jgi:hypothetical protein